MSSQGSKLAQIQMRYQQKQILENAQKKNEAFNDTQKILASSLGTGKVRAMFDERRHRLTAGIDKSFLLEPITVETKTTTVKRVIAPSKPTRYDQKSTTYSKVIVPPLQSRIVNREINGENHQSTHDEPVNSKPNVKKTFIARKPAAVPSTANNQKASTGTLLKSPVKGGTSPTSSATSGRSIGSTRATASGGKTSGKSPTQLIVDENAPVPEGLVRCGICKRNFAEDRIDKHTEICQMTKTKKRKIYDGSKKRVQGTEAETYLRKPISAPRAVKATTTPPKVNNWRSKHEDFIKTIRAAKEMQAYLAKGGKLSDLPPPPPSENLDYVTCPHCSRRFNEGAANRHIPLCKNMQHNKPKPKPQSKAAIGKGR